MFSAADHVLPPLGDKMPDGTIIGARGAYGLMSQKSPLNDWLFKGYEAGATASTRCKPPIASRSRSSA